jgi:hypothetical protein
VLATTACRSSSEAGAPPDPDSSAAPDNTSGADASSGASADGSAPADRGAGGDAGGAGADLAGSADAAPVGKFTPASGDFGSVVVGQQSPSQTFTFTNDGDQATGALTSQLGGSDAMSFLIAEDMCKGASLPPAEKCSITLRFKPLKVGELAGSLIVTAPLHAGAVLSFGGTGLSP